MESNLESQLSQVFDFQPRKGDLKKLEIIEACIECLASIGIEKTTFQAIAEKIGTRRAHIAYHFSNKEDIFLSSVKYIMVTYQQISLEKLELSETPKEKFLAYIDAVFVWAKRYPQQLSVMLLLYYMCTLKGEYRELNHEIRQTGMKRLGQLLREELKVKEDISFKAKTIQNLITSGILDAATTQKKSLYQAKNDTQKACLSFIH